MSERPHWSYNQLSKFLRCPLAYFFEYIQKLPKPFVPSSLALGSAVHEALATYHRRIQESQRCDQETVLGTFLKAWIEREARERILYDGDSRDDLLEQGGSLIRAYLAEPPPEKVVAVEERLLSPLVTTTGEVLEKPLVSVLDLLTREPTGLTITDFKTSGRCLSAAEADLSLQASCYVNAVTASSDEPVHFRFTVLVKTKTPKVQHVEANRTQADLGRLGDVVQAVERAIQAEVFYPVETPLNCCTCPYRGPCRDWTGPPTEGSRIHLPLVTNEVVPC